jgi:chromosome segregation protein
MRLERLEISGFKSFSDRVELAFDQGVTAIVGPNGCGKSNVADAITWVLGEQSAKSLRGDRMEDVIFSGSDARKPGATAEVRLRLSGLPASANGGDARPTPAEFHAEPHGGNGNGSQASGNGHGNGSSENPFAELARSFARDVEVTRRLYRSGESEYLIDGEVCRLRDVHELLMDTGLGAKAYAIIEQGKIGLILSSRPADRRQLIEEAAGITKYKARRRAAELKLEAAQQNLTRIDDIVFEVDKQRGTLKRQAAKARRYRRLREEERRWEKVLFARRYRELAHGIEVARAKVGDARNREAVASGHLAEVEADLARLRIDQVEADARAMAIRERAHAREIEINRRQQQQEFNRHQTEMLSARGAEITSEIRELESRRPPARIALDSQRHASAEAMGARDQAAERLSDANASYSRAQQQIEGLESDVEAARGEVFAALNSATALRHAMEHAAAQRERIGEALGKLDIERQDVEHETAKAEGERTSAMEALRSVERALETLRIERTRRESELLHARSEHEWRARAVRTCEQELAGLEARLASLEELRSSRAEFSDAARMVLVQANGHIGQQGAVADYVDVESRYERAVEACLGDLLQHVIVERHDQAAAGLSLIREHSAGRCGFVVLEPSSNGFSRQQPIRMPGIVPVSEVVRVLGPHASTIQQVLPDGYVAETFEQAVAMAHQTAAPVATLEGDVFRGPHLLAGGMRAESRGILATNREISELTGRIAAERETLARFVEETASVERTIAEATADVAALADEHHNREKELVAGEAAVARTLEDVARVARKAELVVLERRQAEEEHATLDARHAEVQASLNRLQDEQRDAEQRLSLAQRRLMEARGVVDDLAGRAAEIRAEHAGLVERSAALTGDVLRLEETARELEERIAARLGELDQARTQREGLLQALADGERMLDEDVRTLEAARAEVQTADELVSDLRIRIDAQDARIRDARRGLDTIRAEVNDLDLTRVAAESDLGHLAHSCTDTLQTTLDAVLAEVERMEQAGETTPDAAAIAADESEVESEDGQEVAELPSSGEPSLPSMTAEEAIARLKARIDRLGPVNMMAIEQFDELETRYSFLITQRKDLTDSIAQTSEAITRIDETSKARFAEAFTAIQRNFQATFSTLFGGGHAGLALLDENDPLESGIEIVASPPGKRLQSVQLLSGGEKALTAIALMFAIFRYKPSPFCLLDEIDAPLDDANVGRFVEMLQGMMDRTQFILITHNRRTMEIANRLYGVTMEEPGVSKLISVQLN